MGFEGYSLSPGVLRMVGLVAALVSFEEGQELLRELAGVRLSAKHVERAAKALGAEISKYEEQESEPLVTEEEVPDTLYLGMDGTGIPVRKEEVEGRTGKQEDGRAKTREVKLVTIWSAEKTDEEGVPVRDEGSVSYSAGIESAAQRDTDNEPSPFAKRVMREATRRGFQHARRRVILGDGARWIWNLATEYFPDAIQIVDRFHAKQHLCDVAKSIYGVESDLATQWAKERYEELDRGDIDAIVTALRAHASENENARRCIAYLEENQERMQYAEFHAAGLCTSTGVVEAGCNLAIGARCKRPGMHWSVVGANAIIALRCSKLSARFEDFWEYRSSLNRARSSQS